MARIATAADFEGLVPDALYDNYRKFDFFAWRADWVLALHDRLVRAGVLSTTVAQTKVIVAGCGFGFLVEELIARGFDCVGFDTAQYAWDKSQLSVNLTTRGRIQKRDMLNGADYAALKQASNLKRNDPWHIAITEDVLPCLTDVEIEQAIPFCRDNSQVLVHVVTPGLDSDPSTVAPLNWKTMDQWRSFLTETNGTMPDWLLSAEGHPIPEGTPNPMLEYPPDGWVEPAS